MFQRILIVAGSLFVCACAGPVTYAPGCMALAGDRIEVNGTRFVWDKFTDALRVDDDGNRIDPFPDYPRKGRVESTGKRLRFVDDGGSLVGEFVGYRIDGERFLLTVDEYDAVQAGARVPDCALQQETSAQ
jgi:hypothetical protein